MSSVGVNNNVMYRSFIFSAIQGDGGSKEESIIRETSGMFNFRKIQEKSPTVENGNLFNSVKRSLINQLIKIE